MERELSQDKFGRWFQKNTRPNHSYTVFTKSPDSRHGEYAEEIDVLAGTPGQAKNIARIVLEDYYDADLRISGIVKHY